MKRIQIIAAAITITLMHTGCYADCNCDDWMNKGGYCVDYIKARIPAFPIPFNTAEIATLKNKEITEVSAGDVAIFELKRYWHFSYVEKVHMDESGNAKAVDVSEMNFGDQLSYQEYRIMSTHRDESEWKRATCCGVTDKYGQISFRNNIPVNTIKQVWSPASSGREGLSTWHNSLIMGKVKETLNRFLSFTRSKL